MKEKKNLETGPPGICQQCFENPESRLRAPSGIEATYCPHGQVLGFKLKSALLNEGVGWQLHWPIPVAMMDELVRGSLGDVMTWLETPGSEC